MSEMPNVEKIARSASLMVISRLSMIFFSTFGPLVAAWFVDRILTTQEKHNQALAAIAQATALVKSDLVNANVRIGDHEVRIRDLERPGLPPRSRP